MSSLKKKPGRLLQEIRYISENVTIDFKGKHLKVNMRHSSQYENLYFSLWPQQCSRDLVTACRRGQALSLIKGHTLPLYSVITGRYLHVSITCGFVGEDQKGSVSWKAGCLTRISFRVCASYRELLPFLCIIPQIVRDVCFKCTEFHLQRNVW